VSALGHARGQNRTRSFKYGWNLPPRCWPNQDSTRPEEDHGKGLSRDYDERGRQLRRPFRASVFNASRDDDRATIRSDGRDRPDGPTHDHGRPLQGRLNSHAPQSRWDLQQALRTRTWRELRQKRTRQIRLTKAVSCFLPGSRYRDKEESPDRQESSVFETSSNTVFFRNPQCLWKTLRWLLPGCFSSRTNLYRQGVA